MAISGGVRLWLCVAAYGSLLIACSIKPVSYKPLGDSVGGGGDAGVTSPTPDAGAPSPTPDAGAPSPTPDAAEPDPGPEMGTLTVQLGGDGTGSVVAQGVAIACGTQCTVHVPIGTDIVLTATPGSGSFFSGWSGCPSDTESCSFTVTGENLVIARFSLDTRTLHLQLPGNGTGKVQFSTGQICNSDCDVSVPPNTALTLTAVADANSEFVGWDLPTCGPVQTCSVTVTDDLTLSATFTSTLLVTVNFFSSGPFGFSGSFLPCPRPPGASLCGQFAVGQTLFVSASTPMNQIFTGWGGDCAAFGTATQCTLPLTPATPILNIILNYAPTGP